jgi:hypothetical protein
MTAPACLAWVIDSFMLFKLQSKSIAHWFKLQVATFNSLMVFSNPKIQENPSSVKIHSIKTTPRSSKILKRKDERISVISRCDD